MEDNNNPLILSIILILLVFGLSRNLQATGPASIEFISPKEGEIIETGSVNAIKWQTKNIPVSDKVAINIRRVPPPSLQEEGQEFDPIIITNIYNSGSRDWSVSNMYPDGNYILGITSYPSTPVIQPVIAESKQFTIKRTGKSVTFLCDSAKTIGAVFYPENDRFVSLELSDGRNLSVPRAISASGARYANTDETFVFWNKGDTAFITEGEDFKETFSGCLLKAE